MIITEDVSAHDVATILKVDIITKDRSAHDVATILKVISRLGHHSTLKIIDIDRQLIPKFLVA